MGLALALLVMDMKRGQGWFRVVAILPVVLSPAVVGMIWRTFMLAPEFGIVDYLAINAGLGSRNWLGDPLLAMISVIIIHTWQWTPFAFMVLLASLASLPEDIYEAARLDRATAWQRFRRITLPLLRPAIVMVVIMRTMVALTAFAAIFTVTAGGPGTATEILNLYAYRKSFTELSIGYGSALAVALLIVTILISAVLFALRRANDRKALSSGCDAGDQPGLPAGMDIPDFLERAEFIQDRPRRAGLSAEAHVHADARRLS